MFHEDILSVNILKLNFWLVICIAKNKFKDDFLNIYIFLHSQIPDYQILSYINENILYSAFRWCINPNFEKYDWFCAPESHLLTPCQRDMLLYNIYNIKV